ncbi:MAG: MgtC/SapB family protein [Patescibacteria group bacterium]
MEITTLLNDPNFETVMKLFTALFLGMSLGIERAIVGKTAGMRTYGLVTMGSALFVIIGVTAAGGFNSAVASVESLRMTGQIIVGVGFLGAGLIFHQGAKVSGVTTAAGIWVAAGIGMAIGYGLYVLAVATTVLAIFIFTVLWNLENSLKKFAHQEDKED